MEVKNNDFSDIILGRRSIRPYNPEVKIAREEMLEMIRKATLAPSAVNMQPWRFVVIESTEGKEKLRPLIHDNYRQNDSSAESRKDYAL